jgi:Rho termination factor, N-terminal domain
MFDRNRSEKLKKNAASASALALALAQDKRFRKRLLSALEHGAAAGRRTRRELGLRGVVGRLAADQKLLNELSSARNDLQQAYGRLEAKKRRRRLRNFLVLTGLATVTSIPRLRARLWTVFSKVSKRFPLPGEASRSTNAAAGSSAGPNRLEDLTKEELYARAQEADIPGRSEMSKEDLIEALRARG